MGQAYQDLLWLQILAYVSEQEKSEAARQRGARAVSADQVLWHVLGLLIQHDGQLNPITPAEKGLKGRTPAAKTGAPPAHQGSSLDFRTAQMLGHFAIPARSQGVQWQVGDLLSPTSRSERLLKRLQLGTLCRFRLANGAQQSPCAM